MGRPGETKNALRSSMGNCAADSKDVANDLATHDDTHVSVVDTDGDNVEFKLTSGRLSLWLERKKTIDDVQWLNWDPSSRKLSSGSPKFTQDTGLLEIVSTLPPQV